MLADSAYTQRVTPDKCTIVTSRPLVLTQEEKLPPGSVRVVENADLEVLGDQVTIRGRICAPGKTIKIFARSLLIETVSIPDRGEQPAELNVDGANGATRDPQKAAPPEGTRGEHGINTTINPWKMSGDKRPGGRGRSANLLWEDQWFWTDPNIPAWARYNGEPENNDMHGVAGLSGNPGSDGGRIFVYCGSVPGGVSGAKLLILSAKGGKGGDGQEGQGGAKGGPGGTGSGAIHRGPGGYTDATGGGPGGRGGDGGAGGRAGNAGNGGRVVFRTTDASALPYKDFPGEAIKCFADGGFAGAPGQGGKRGEAGEPGPGGHGFGTGDWDPMKMPPGLDGDRGIPGRDGGSGGEGSNGAEGFVDRRLTAKFGDLKSGFRTMK